MPGSVYLQRENQNIIKAAATGVTAASRENDDWGDVPVIDIEMIGVRKHHASGKVTANVYLFGKRDPVANVLVFFPKKNYDLVSDLAKEGWGNYADFTLMPMWELATTKHPDFNLLAAKESALSRKSKITVNARAVDSLASYLIKKHRGTIISLFEGDFVVVQEKISYIQAELKWEILSLQPSAPRIKVPDVSHYCYG